MVSAKKYLFKGLGILLKENENVIDTAYSYVLMKALEK